jgi:hypothetical protein
MAIAGAGRSRTIGKPLGQQFHGGVDEVALQISRFCSQAGDVRAVDHQRYLRRDTVGITNAQLPRLTLESIASREGKSERSIRMTLSLAFLAPEIIKAAVEGRLPRGFGIKRLVDLPMAWPDQWRTLGLQAPAQV